MTALAAISRYKRFDASLLFPVESLIAPQPLTVVYEPGLPAGSRMEIYERGGNADEYDDRLVLEIRRNAHSVWGTLRHSSRDASWMHLSLTAIHQMIRDAGECTSIDEFCSLLGESDEQREAREAGLTYAERRQAYRDSQADAAYDR